jgi:hypothetical protein
MPVAVVMAVGGRWAEYEAVGMADIMEVWVDVAGVMEAVVQAAATFSCMPTCQLLRNMDLQKWLHELGSIHRSRLHTLRRRTGPSFRIGSRCLARGYHILQIYLCSVRRQICSRQFRN